jgi:hypothetical protein
VNGKLDPALVSGQFHPHHISGRMFCGVVDRFLQHSKKHNL